MICTNYNIGYIIFQDKHNNLLNFFFATNFGQQSRSFFVPKIESKEGTIMNNHITVFKNITSSIRINENLIPQILNESEVL